MNRLQDSSSKRNRKGYQLKNLLKGIDQASEKKVSHKDKKFEKAEENDQNGTVLSKHPPSTDGERSIKLMKHLRKDDLIKKRTATNLFHRDSKRSKMENLNKWVEDFKKFKTSTTGIYKFKKKMKLRTDKIVAGQNLATHSGAQIIDPLESDKKLVNEAQPLNYGEDVEPLDCDDISDQLRQQNFSSFNLWLEWAKERNIKNQQFNGKQSVPLDLGLATDKQLNFWFYYFIEEKLTKSNKIFTSRTLKQILSGLQGYLQKHVGRQNISFMKTIQRVVKDSDTEYQKIKKLKNEDYKKKELKKSLIKLTEPSVKIVLPGQFCNPSFPAKPKLLLLKHFNKDVSFDLVRAVFYHCIVTFNLKSIEEHLNLKLSDFKIGHSEGKSYVEFATTRNVRSLRKTLKKKVQNVGCNSEKVLLRVYNDGFDDVSIVSLFSSYINLISRKDIGYELEDHGAFYQVWHTNAIDGQLVNKPLHKISVTSYFEELSEVSKKFVAKFSALNVSRKRYPTSRCCFNNFMIRSQLRIPSTWLDKSSSSDFDNDEVPVYSIHLLKQTPQQMFQSGIEFNRRLRENLLNVKRRPIDEATRQSSSVDDN